MVHGIIEALRSNDVLMNWALYAKAPISTKFQVTLYPQLMATTSSLMVYTLPSVIPHCIGALLGQLCLIWITKRLRSLWLNSECGVITLQRHPLPSLWVLLFCLNKPVRYTYDYITLAVFNSF